MIVNPDAIVGAEARARRSRVRPWSTPTQPRTGSSVVDIDPPRATTGFIAAGTTYDALRQAFVDLGITDQDLLEAGIRVLRLGLITPLEPGAVERFADGLDEIVVVEDKTSFIETQVREILYGRPGAPRVLGKKDADGRPLVPADGELTSGRLLAPLRHVLGDRLAITPPRPKTHQPADPVDLARAVLLQRLSPQPLHGRPRGIARRGGIGCHVMVTVSGRTDSAVTGFTQMGGEGAQWIGQSAVHATRPHLPEHRRRHVLPLRPARHPGLHRRRREHHVQDPLQRRRRHDRCTGRRRVRSTVPQLTHKLKARGRRAHHRLSPTSRSGTVVARSRRARCSGTATGSTRRSGSCATSPASPCSSTTSTAPPRRAASASGARCPRATRAS